MIGSTVQPAAGTIARAGPRCRSIEPISTSTSRPRRASSSARVTMATTVSRSAISTGSPAAISSRSTCETVGPGAGEHDGELRRVDVRTGEDDQSRHPAQPGPGGGHPLDQAAEESRARRGRSGPATRRCWPRSHRPGCSCAWPRRRRRAGRGRSGSPRARIRAACDQAGSVLWAETHQRVGPLLERVPGQRRVEAEVRGPGRVDDQWCVVGVRHGSDPGDVGQSCRRTTGHRPARRSHRGPVGSRRRPPRE